MILMIMKSLTLTSVNGTTKAIGSFGKTGIKRYENISTQQRFLSFNIVNFSVCLGSIKRVRKPCPKSFTRPITTSAPSVCPTTVIIAALRGEYSTPVMITIGPAGITHKIVCKI